MFFREWSNKALIKQLTSVKRDYYKIGQQLRNGFKQST